MNIDERLEALTAKTEVLFQFQYSHESNLNRLFEMQAKSEGKLDRLFDLQAKNEIILADLMESVQSLARIAHAHEQRISKLER